MTQYDADRPPQPQAWLELDEQERIDLVVAYHRGRHPATPHVKAHAIIHVVVETQLAMNEMVVVDTLKRLQEEGLSRHDAVHAIASVLASHMYDLVNHEPPRDSDPNEAYFDELRTLTAERWRNSN